MAKFKLNVKDNIFDSTLFWFKKYLKFKMMTLSNKKANKDNLRQAIIDIEKANDFKEIDIAIKSIYKQIDIYTYYYPISSFLQWLLNNGVIDDLKDIDTELVLEWLTINTSSKKGETKSNYRNVLMNFFKYLENENEEEYMLKINLSSWQKNLKNLATKKPDYLSEDEVDRFLIALENHKFIKGGHRGTAKEDKFLRTLYTLAIKIALFSGLRISEIANLEEDDLHIDKALDRIEIYVRDSKNNKYRIVSIPYAKGKYVLKNDLDNYLETRKAVKEQYCPTLKNQLFFTYKCKKLAAFTMQRILKNILKEAGILTQKKGMHMLRHTQASFFYKKTQDVLLLKERLGHDNIKTTMRYTHLDEEKIKKSADAMR